MGETCVRSGGEGVVTRGELLYVAEPLKSPRIDNLSKVRGDCDVTMNRVSDDDLSHGFDLCCIVDVSILTYLWGVTSKFHVVSLPLQRLKAFSILHLIQYSALDVDDERLNGKYIYDMSQIIYE